jgi:hypothetical protein
MATRDDAHDHVVDTDRHCPGCLRLAIELARGCGDESLAGCIEQALDQAAEQEANARGQHVFID